MQNWERFDKAVKIGSHLLLVTMSSSAKVNFFTAILKSWILVFGIFWLGCMTVKSQLPLCCPTAWCFGQQRSEMEQAEKESELWSPVSNITSLNHQTPTQKETTFAKSTATWHPGLGSSRSLRRISQHNESHSYSLFWSLKASKSHL